MYTYSVVEKLCTHIVWQCCYKLMHKKFCNLSFYKYRVTTCLENLEMSVNLTAVREMSVILLKIRELSGKKSCQGKVT